MSRQQIDVPATWPGRFFGEAFIEIFERLGKFDATESDVEQIVSLMNLAPGAKILDVPCGFGRFAGRLHKKGYQVTGIDISEQLLQHAREWFPGPTYLNLDMRTPLEANFDVVLNLWTSFGYFEDHQEDHKALEAWYGALKPGGILIMEYSDLERAQAENAPGDEAVTFSQRAQNGVLDEVWISWADRTATTRYTLGTYQIVGRTYIYERDELAALVKDVGFEAVQIYGGFDKRPKQPSDRLVLFTRRPANGVLSS